jgi:hypothetical protein
MGLNEVDGLLLRAREIDLPDGLGRRTGTMSSFRRALSRVQAELTAINDHTARVTDLGDDEPRRARVDLSLELASILYSAGAPHRQWRWWAGRAARALLKYGEVARSAVWAVLACDDDLIAQLPPAPNPGRSPDRIVWWVAERARPDRRDNGDDREATDIPPDDPLDAAWTTLVRSIPAADHAATDRALRTITDFWLEEDEDWEAFHPGYHPDFEPELNAAVALARRSGWQPRCWPDDAMRFVDPGLASAAS